MLVTSVLNHISCIVACQLSHLICNFAVAKVPFKRLHLVLQILHITGISFPFPLYHLQLVVFRQALKQRVLQLILLRYRHQIILARLHIDLILTVILR